LTGPSLEVKTSDDWKKQYIEERERLAKLWDAYEAQEKELSSLKGKVLELEKAVGDKERIVRSLKDVLEARDRENREYEIELTSLRADKTSFEPKLKEVSQNLRVEKERFAKLFGLAEELDEELREARKQIEARDEWFRIHVDVLSNVGKAIEERERLIEAAKSKRTRTDFKPAIEKLSVPDTDTKPNI
jgi:chromosome segregation ATPase